MSMMEYANLFSKEWKLYFSLIHLCTGYLINQNKNIDKSQQYVYLLRNAINILRNNYKPFINFYSIEV